MKKLRTLRLSIFFLFLVLFSFSNLAVKYQDYAYTCTNTSEDFTGCGSYGAMDCYKIMDGISVSGSCPSPTEYIPERDTSYPDMETLTIDLNQTLYTIETLNVSLSCTIGGDQNPEAIRVWGRYSNADAWSMIGFRNFSPYSCGGTCNSGEPHEFPFNLSSVFVNGLNYIKVDIYRNNCTNIDGINELWIEASSSELNRLPSFNLTMNRTQVCVQNTSSTVDFNYSIDAYDKEGDTIYYGYHNLSKQYFNPVVVEFQTEDCRDLFCSHNEDYSFLENTVLDGHCTIYPYGFSFYNSTNMNLVYYKGISESIFDTGHRYMLELTSECSGGTPDFEYNFDEDITLLDYTSIIYDFDDEGEEFNLSFYDSTKTNLINKLKFKYLSGNLEVFDYNSTSFNLLLNHSSQDRNLILKYLFDPDTLTFTFTYNGTDYTLTDLYDYFPVKKVVYEIDDNTIFYLNSFVYGGVSDSEIIWTTTKPNSTTFGYGIRKLIIYYTDEINKARNIWDHENVYLRVGLCSEITDKSVIESADISGSDLNILKWLQVTLGIPLRNYINTFSLGIARAKTLLWWIWLILFFSAFILENIFFSGNSISFPLFTSSLICGFLSFLLNYYKEFTGHFVAFLFLIALAFALPVAQHFLLVNNIGGPPKNVKQKRE